MKKIAKIAISALCVTTMATTAVVGALNNSSATAENNPLAFSSAIRAVTPYDGETVEMNTAEINRWWDSETIDFDLLRSLYAYTEGHENYNAVVDRTSSGDFTELLNLIKTTDDFKPVNNVLKWTDTVENVASYTVRVALDSKFTKTVQRVENADPEKGVVVENPFDDTQYFWQVIANLENGGKTYSNIFSFETDFSVRTVEFEGVSNSRDIGGFDSQYGYVQQGLIYRTARLETMTEKGRTAFDRLNIKTDLDLRGYNEAGGGTNKRDPLGLESQYFVFETPYYASGSTIGQSGSGLNDSRRFEAVKGIMTMLADKNNYPVNMHCSVGRDRTGTITILLKTLLGVSELEIRKDYYVSMFAVPCAFIKEDLELHCGSLDRLFNFLKTFDGATLADKTEDYLKECCGVTQGQIDNIRNILTGAEGYEVKTINTFADTDNYDGYSFVTFKQFGTPAQTVAVANGEKAVAPFALTAGYVWMLNGQAFDMETAIQQDMMLVAGEGEYYTVTVNDVANGTSYEVKVQANGWLDFSLLQKDGFTALVLDKDGNEVIALQVDKDCVLNVLYMQS